MAQFTGGQLAGGLVLVATLAAARFYLLFAKRQRILRRVDAAQAAYVAAGGVPFAQLPTRHRVSRAARFTALVPGGCTALILIAFLVGGRFQRDPGVTIDLLELATLYFAGSVFIGVALGFGAPVMRGFVRASIVGIIAIAPLSIGCVLSMDEGHWGTFETILAAGMSVALGTALGYGASRGERLEASAARRSRLAHHL